MGHLVHYPAGPSGAPGIGYDYLLGAGGLYVQSQSDQLSARLRLAACAVRGLAPFGERLELRRGPIPAELFELGLGWLREDPETERFFAIGWDRRAYRLVVPEQVGAATSVHYRPPAGVVAEFHSHGPAAARFSATDDRDEQGFRIYGVCGRLDAERPEVNLRLGLYGHFAPLRWGQVFRGPAPALRLVNERTPDQQHQQHQQHQQQGEP